MDRILVWDIPTRLFHWLLTAVFTGAAGVALLVDDDSRLFQLHMLLGLVAGFLVVLRLIWGLVGTRYARFASFLFGPGQLVGYLRGALRGTAERTIGHNPGAAWATWAMLLLPIGLAASGPLLHTWKDLKELHEILAYSMLAVVAAHVVGVALYTRWHGENLALSMVTGRKRGETSQAIASAHGAAGAVLLVLTAAWSYLLVDGYDPLKRELSIFGQTIQLGDDDEGREAEHEGDGERPGRYHDEDDDD